MDRPTIETKRLVLRPFTLDDAPVVARHCADRTIADTTLNIPHPYSEEDARTFIGGHQEGFESGKQVTLAVQLRDGELVGAVGLDVKKAHGNAELGYWIAVTHWNNGYATEAVRAVLSYAFEEMGLRRVHAHHFTRNPSSGRVMEKAGMRREGLLRQHVLRWDRPEDLACYGILAEELDRAAD